jgi:hypothetical protein
MTKLLQDLTKWRMADASVQDAEIALIAEILASEFALLAVRSFSGEATLRSLIETNRSTASWS